MAKLPTYEEMAQEVAQRALDECEYEGKTLREWIEIIKTQRGTDCISKSRWEPVKILHTGRVCMACGTVFEKEDIGNGKANFCPNCGCDMRGEQDG